jgi:Zn-finger nucleic acid-binding protein
MKIQNQPPSEIEHKVKRNPVTGSPYVHFACPKCEAALNSPLKDAGQAETCPQCQGTFRTPGIGARVEEEKRLVEKARLDEEARLMRRQEEQTAAVLEAAKSKERDELKAERKRQRKAKTPRTSSFEWVALLFVCLGLGLVVLGLFVSELSPQVLLVLCGTIIICTGFILRALAGIGAEINRWGNQGRE